MSNSNPTPMRRMPQMPELPKGEAISTYDHYVDAMQAVDRLARANFPVNAVSILGNDVRSVERVTPNCAASAVSVGSSLPAGMRPSRIASRILSLTTW